MKTITKAQLALVLGCMGGALACGDDAEGRRPDAGETADADGAADGDADASGDGGDGSGDGGDGSGDGGDGGSGDGSGDGGDSGDGDGDAPDAGDAGGDSDAGDADGDAELWDACPAAEAFVGPAPGERKVVATEQAVYCSMFQETRTLKEELAAKAMLRVTPGDYPLPDQAEAPYRLPVCIRTPSNPQPALVSAGTVDYSSGEYMGVTTHNYDWTQPMQVGNASRTLLTHLELKQSASSPDGDLTLDGSHPLLFVDESADRASFTLCEDPENCWPALQFDSCHFEGSYAHTHEVELTDQGAAAGSLELHLQIGDSFASTEPGAFVRANGTFRGVAFDQQDYWKLVYSPEHHHFSRDFAVFFDAPIDGACGIEITGLEPFTDDYNADGAYTVDCALNRLETLTVAAHTHTRTDP